MKRVLAVAISLAMCWTSSGCSMLFVKAPPADHAQRAYFACTTSRVGPVVDALISIGHIISGAAVLSEGADVDADARLPLAGVLAGVAVLFGASAAGGLNDASACDDALAQANVRRLNAAALQQARAQPNVAISCVTHDHCKQGRFCVYGACSDTPMPQPSLALEGPALLFEGLPPQAPFDAAPDVTPPSDAPPQATP